MSSNTPVVIGCLTPNRCVKNVFMLDKPEDKCEIRRLTYESFLQLLGWDGTDKYRRYSKIINFDMLFESAMRGKCVMLRVDADKIALMCFLITKTVYHYMGGIQHDSDQMISFNKMLSSASIIEVCSTARGIVVTVDLQIVDGDLPKGDINCNTCMCKKDTGNPITLKVNLGDLISLRQ